MDEHDRLGRIYPLSSFDKQACYQGTGLSTTYIVRAWLCALLQ